VEGLRETWVVAGAESRRTLKSARIIVLFLLFAMFTGLVTLVLGLISAQLQTQAATLTGEGTQQAQAAMDAARTGLLGFFFDWDRDFIESLEQLPLIVLLVFRVVLFFLPFYVAVMAFDQLSGELGPRAIRYLTVRSRRSSVLLGKFLANAALLALLVGLVNAGVFLYGYLTSDGFGGGALALWALRLWLAALVYGLAWLALTTVCSALFRAPVLSLVFNFFVLFALWLVDRIGSAFVERPLGPDGFPGPEQTTSWAAALRFVTPSHWSTGLLHPNLEPFAVSGGALLGFTLLYLLAAWAILRARDV
jgi:ABC-2 type transport system permease protein